MISREARTRTFGPTLDPGEVVVLPEQVHGLDHDRPRGVGHGAPDLVALQEVTLYRRQTPSDYQPGDGPNATEVVLDFLATLMAEIDALGGGYRVAGESPNADVELPVSDGAGGVFDIRLTDRDVILARDTVRLSSSESSSIPRMLIMSWRSL